MLLNKVLFVSLLVLGLCFLQPALGEQRLATRIAGGFLATTGQFPFVVLIQYPYTVNGNTFTYQGTGVLYNNNTVITSANAIFNCNGQITITQGSTNTFAPESSAQVLQFTCVPGTNVVLAPGFVQGSYQNDIAAIFLPLSFSGSVSLRAPTSSPTAADIGSLFAVGWGESLPGAIGSPQLIWVPLNPQRNRVCYDRAVKLNNTLVPNFVNTFSFAENFCVSGFEQSPVTGNVTDACVLDAGAPIIRTSNINAPYADHEVVGIVNFGSCTASSPVIVTYLYQYINSVLFGGAQTNPPPAGSPANPRAFDGNFACGDGQVTSALEKCDPSSTDRNALCCDKWTCQLKTTGTACTVLTGGASNRNGTKCQTQPRCNTRGKCVVKFRNHNEACNGPKTRCSLGKCCTFPGRTNCVVV